MPHELVSLYEVENIRWWEESLESLVREKPAAGGEKPHGFGWARSTCAHLKNDVEWQTQLAKGLFCMIT